MVDRPFIGLSNGHLLDRLASAAEHLHEVGDTERPYFAGWYQGLSRRAVWESLARDFYLLVDECEHRGLSWHEPFWRYSRVRPVSDSWR